MINKIKIRLSISILSLIVVISTMTVSISGEVNKISTASEDYKNKLIRFHVIANSDSEEDQNLKLKVRDAVIDYLQPKLANSNSIEESEKIIISEYEELENISKNIILENGYEYGVNVGIDYSEFPTKQYSNVVLPSGEYKALRIIIGEGSGKNWWCVMFPPLCFVDEQKGLIDKETDAKLREVLTEEEYELITQSNKKQVNKVQVKFKIVEILQNIINK